jgi:hypothetical protein
LKTEYQKEDLMKKQLLALLFLVVGVSNLLAQAASVQWDCTADANPTTTVGNVVPQPIIGNKFVVRDYNGTTSTGPLSVTQQRWWPGKDAAGATISWGLETKPLADRYIQIEVAPKDGYNFKITKVEMYMAAGGTDAMRANVAFSTDPSFTPSTSISDTIKLKQGKTKPEDTVIVYAGNVEVKAGGKFLVRIFPWYTGGASTSKYVYLQKVSVTGTTSPGTSVEESSLPVEFNLNQNYPNPFNPETTINYSIPSNVKGETINVTLKVFDALGKEVATLVNENKQPGNYNSQFSIRNSSPRSTRVGAGQLSSGVYFYRLQAGSFTSTKKMILAK